MKKEFFFYYDRTRNVIENKAMAKVEPPKIPTLHRKYTTYHEKAHLTNKSCDNYDLQRKAWELGMHFSGKSRGFEPIYDTRIGFSILLTHFPAHSTEYELARCPVEPRQSAIPESLIPCPVPRVPCLTLGGTGN
jgi:hypothetical protein